MISDDEARKLAQEVEKEYLSLHPDAGLLAREYKLAHKLIQLLDRQRWIPVSVQTPPDGVQVLTYPGWAAGESGISMDQWSNHYSCFLMCIEDGHEITHWMPLPQPPEQP